MPAINVENVHPSVNRLFFHILIALQHQFLYRFKKRSTLKTLSGGFSVIVLDMHIRLRIVWFVYV